MKAAAGNFAKYFVNGNLQDPRPYDGGEFILDEALKYYESFYILEAQHVKWSPEHLFRCNCPDCFKTASCVHPIGACRNGL